MAACHSGEVELGKWSEMFLGSHSGRSWARSEVCILFSVWNHVDGFEMEF